MPKSLIRMLVLLVLPGCFLAGGCTESVQTSPQAAASLEQAVRAFEAEVMSSYNRGNAGAAARHYADDAFVFIPGQPPTRGREAIRANISRFMQDPNFKLGYGNEILDVAASNDVAYTRGKLQVTSTDTKTGAVRTTNGNYILVMRREAGSDWQVVEDISF